MQNHSRLAWVLCCVVAVVGVAHWAQQPPEKLRISIAGGAITGWEEYRLEKGTDGYRLTSKMRFGPPGREIEQTQELALGPAWDLLRYKLESQMGGQSETIEAWREGEQVEMRASGPGQSRSGAAPVRPRTLVLDNLVFSQYQVLLDSVARKVTGSEELWALVPQQVTAVPGKLAAVGEEAATLGGQSIRVRKYTLELASVLLEIWTQADTNRLMRVYVPVQRVEAAREGFALLPRAEEKPPAGVVERALKFPSGSLEMPATLCLPAKRSGRLPAVVFVHGSGAHDRDETIGPNKPFRDLAHGLAESGIASLRYDKRSFAFPKQLDLKTVTVEQEVIEDAAAALTYAQSVPEIDPARLFLLGHSLGATMAPLIAGRVPGLRGVILLAALARPIEETLLDQMAYQGRVANQSEEQIARRSEELRKAFSRIRSGEAADGEIVFAAPAGYWRDFMRREPLAALRKLAIPVLVLQGGKDYQVKKVDYDRIQEALAEKPATLRESHFFPNLNHLFMPVEEKSTGLEYGRPGRVAPEVIHAITAWINKQVAPVPAVR